MTWGGIQWSDNATFGNLFEGRIDQGPKIGFIQPEKPKFDLFLFRSGSWQVTSQSIVWSAQVQVVG